MLPFNGKRMGVVRAGKAQKGGHWGLELFWEKSICLNAHSPRSRELRDVMFAICTTQQCFANIVTFPRIL